MKSISQIFAVLAVALPLAALAQTNPPVPVSVGDVTDTRTTGSSSFNAGCQVQLRFTGDAAADAQSVRQVQLVEATDSTGRDLIRPTDDAMPFQPFGFGQAQGTLSTEVKLRNPSRNASSIKMLRGQVEFFNPTEANGGILTIKDILKHPAEPVQNAELAKYNIQLIYLTREAYEAKKKELESQQGAGGKLGDAFGELFKGMFGNMISDSKNSIQLYVNDPDKRIIQIKFLDGQGKPLKSNQSWSSNEFRSTTFESTPPADTQLSVQVATPEALKTYSFQAENIALP